MIEICTNYTTKMIQEVTYRYEITHTNPLIALHVGLGVYRYLCTRVEYVIHGRVPGTQTTGAVRIHLKLELSF